MYYLYLHCAFMKLLFPIIHGPLPDEAVVEMLVADDGDELLRSCNSKRWNNITCSSSVSVSGSQSLRREPRDPGVCKCKSCAVENSAYSTSFNAARNLIQSWHSWMLLNPYKIFLLEAVNIRYQVRKNDYCKKLAICPGTFYYLLILSLKKNDIIFRVNI